MQLQSFLGSRKPLLVFTVSVVALLLLLVTRPQVPLVEEKEKVWPVEVAKVVYGAHQPQLTLLGHVESPSDSQMTAAVEADVLRTYVSEGLLVEESQLLVGLDTAESLMGVALRSAEVEDLEAQIQIEKNNHQAALEAIGREKELLSLNQAAVEREKQLTRQKLGSESRLDEARIAVEQQGLAVNSRRLLITNHESRLNQLGSRLNRARSLLGRARLDLERTNVRAPFAGRISKLHVAVGERVNPGAPVIDLYAADKLEVRALIPERYLETVTHSMQQQVAVGARINHLGGILQLKLDRLAGAVDQSRGGIDGIFTLQASTSTLPLGKPVQVVLDLPPIADTLGVPMRAIFSDNRVYKVIEQRLQVVNIVKMGAASSPDGAPIIIARCDALRPGDIYITTQLPNPVTGLKVEVISGQATFSR